MATNPIQSAWLRFFRKFGVAFFWAFVVGVLFGSAAYFRLDRRELEGDPRWHVQLRLLLERIEWATFDWRARELGAESDRSDDVVLVAIDEETMLNARESEHPEWAMNPWPRDLLGAVAEQALREGASLVIIDEALNDVSPHHCVACKGDTRKTDDELLGARLEKLEGKVALGFEWQREARRPADRPLTPFLVKVGDYDDVASAISVVRTVFSRHATAYLFTADGKRNLWAGASSEAKVKELAASLELKSPSFRGLSPSDDEHEITREWLLTDLAGVAAQGIDPDALTKVGTLDGPVTALVSSSSVLGATTMTPDPDGVVRALPLLLATGDAQPTVLPSLVVQGLTQAQPQAIHVEGRRMSIEVASAIAKDSDTTHSVPIDSRAFLTLQWNDDAAGKGGRGTMKRVVPAWRLLVNRDDDDAGRGLRHHDNDLTKRVVVLTDARRATTYLTPVGRLSRAAIIAQGLTNVLHDQGIVRTRPEIDFWITVAFALVGGILAVIWSSVLRRPGWLAWVATIVIVAAIYAFISRQLFVTQLRWVVVAAPLFAFTFTFLASLGYAGALEQRLREFVLSALGGAVRADVFRRVERDLALMRPERRELTMYFSDIEGFTAVAQTQDPATVVGVLQSYLSEMTTLVLDREGHVDKYLGDGLMAFWGAPVAIPNMAALTCEAALAMQAKFEEKKAGWEKKLGRSLSLRAGIEAGDTLVGEMGTMHRVNYTVMGEPVAMAFRLEALAKRYDASILVGPQVAKAAGTSFVFREVDTVRLGRNDGPLKLFELLGRADDLVGETARLQRYAQGLEAYRARRFADAQTIFKALVVEQPDDKLLERYVARCAVYLVTPPPENWDGVFSGAEP